jgi:Zn-dependent protease
VSYEPAGQTAPERARFQPSVLFLGLAGTFVVSAAMAWLDIFNTVNVFLFVTSGWVLTLCLHEYAHALGAYMCGDYGVAQRGYLSLNPRRFTHPFISLVYPLLFLLVGGLGMPGALVWINYRNIADRVRETVIALVGPAVNLGLLVVLAIPMRLGLGELGHAQFWAGWSMLVFVQVSAVVLSLLPIPGTDVGSAIRPWLSTIQARRMWDLIAPYGMFGVAFILVVIWSIDASFLGLVSGISNALGVPPPKVADGVRLYRFWLRLTS